MAHQLIDTHCHLDAPEFAPDRATVVERAQAVGVTGIVIPAIRPDNFQAVQDLAHRIPGGAYALGIHPLAVSQVDDQALSALEASLRHAQDDPRLVAVGEIGLDFFVPAASTPAARERQIVFYERQLDLARQFGLPVLLHVRKSQDRVLKSLRQRPGIGGIAHAFNGSFQQAEQFLALGFTLGFGGAMTFERARQIRRLAAQLPAHALVLETDAPDMAPAWLGRNAAGGSLPARNEPAQLARIAQELATLRAQPVAEIAQQCAHNALRVLPRLPTA